MYFDIAPKSREEDFFNYEFQRKALLDAIKRKEKIVSVEGVRRVGKTSLMNLAFCSLKKDACAWIDGRILKNPVPELQQIISSVVEKKRANIFGRIEGIGFNALGVGIDVRTKPSAVGFEKALKNSSHFYAFIDEAQRTDATGLANFISYCYDRCPNITFIVSGSEIGVLQDVLGTDDPEHALYGRNICHVQMDKLDKSKSIDFLTRGFSELGTAIDEEEIADAINELDGLIGWLTMFGYNRAVSKKPNALKETVATAVQISASELSHFLSSRKEPALYRAIIKKADGISWSELKAKVEKETGRELNSNSFSEALARLQAHSFIDKKDDKYSLCDPIFLKAVFSV